uniref:HNH nuclease domain-containing protein n=1 Tax=Pyrodinium bahamense TaxID=73915 RepID=A0A7S0AIX2_9DINO|mmetsp:Transcript_34673/g.95868  ORF Transcript_34673/g.95868 Transcript_34673/m.95868 type:complete len:401 (+) Transcript_34673:67-1269(+)
MLVLRAVPNVAVCQHAFRVGGVSPAIVRRPCSPQVAPPFHCLQHGCLFFCTWQVSSHGRVQNKRGHIHWGHRRPDGYCSIKLRRQGLPKEFLVHRLVAAHFLPLERAANRLVVHHKDGIRHNNHVSNLEYVSQSQNIKSFYASRPLHSMHAARCKPVLVRFPGHYDWRYLSAMKEACLQTGVSCYHIRKCCKGNTTHVRDYSFLCAEPPRPLQIASEVWHCAVDPRSGSVIAGWRVSSSGRVQSATTGRAHWGSLHPNGYRYVHVRGSNHSVHKLVARSFLGPVHSKEERFVNHKDGNKENNHVDNLEYVTASANSHHAYAVLGHKPSGAPRPVKGRRCGSVEWTEYESATAAARILRLHRTAITKCCRGGISQTGGFEFTYWQPPTLDGEEWRDVVVFV